MDEGRSFGSCFGGKLSQKLWGQGVLCAWLIRSVKGVLVRNFDQRLGEILIIQLTFNNISDITRKEQT